MCRSRVSRVLPSSLVLALFLALACNAGSDVSRLLGARCQDHDQCDGLCLRGARYPDGFCSLSCSRDRDCPGGAACVDLDQGVCLFSCDEPGDCEFLGAGWSCRPLDSRADGDTVMVCAGPDDAGGA